MPSRHVLWAELCQVTFNLKCHFSPCHFFILLPIVLPIVLPIAYCLLASIEGQKVMVLLKMDLPGHCYGSSKNGPSRSLLWFF